MTAVAITRQARCLRTTKGSWFVGLTVLWGAALLTTSGASAQKDENGEAAHVVILPQHRRLENSTNTTADDSSDSDSDDDAQSLFAEVGANVLLFLLIFGLSATVDMKQMRKQLSNKFAIMTGVSMQFIIMPFLGFVAVSLMRGNEGFSNAMAITLLIVTASPGGAFSNWWCSTFNADLALSVAMTALSTILSTFLLPANLVLYAHLAFGFSENEDTATEQDVLANLNWRSLFTSLGVVISAILLGLWASSKVPSQKFRQWANRMGTFAGLFLMGFSAVVSSSGGEDGEETSLWSHGWTFYVGVSFPCLAGLVVANFLSRLVRLTKPESVTVSVECCYQNVGIATSAAVAMFTNKTERGEALSVPLLYGLVEALVLGFYCIWAWKAGWTKAPANEAICTVISKSYEIEDEEGGGDDKRKHGGGAARSEGHPGGGDRELHNFVSEGLDQLEAAAVAPPATAVHDHQHHQHYNSHGTQEQYHSARESQEDHHQNYSDEGEEHTFQHEDQHVANEQPRSPSWKFWKATKPTERGRVDSTDAHTATTGTTRNSNSSLSTPNARPEGTMVELSPSPLSTPSIVTGAFTPLHVAGEDVTGGSGGGSNLLERLEKAQDYDLPHGGSGEYMDARANESSGQFPDKSTSATSLGMDDYYVTTEEMQAAREGVEVLLDEEERPKSLPSVQ